MAKLKKKRGGDFGRQRRRSRTAADMTKDEAALAIQKSKNSTIEKKRPSLALFRLCQVTKSLFVCPVWLTEGYRGYSVRKEYGCGPNKPKRFQCSTIQEEAANTIQYFWRKWKGKSLFQQLLFYRADKQQQLTYFCQQVRTFTFRRFDPL